MDLLKYVVGKCYLMTVSLKKNYICGFRCVIFAVLVVSLRSIHDVINLKFYIQICGFSSTRRKYATMFILFALYKNVCAIVVPHRVDTDIIMSLNMVALYD